ncbi:MAG: hypothetical protein UY56_C0005G0066 [Parcubacteria group bacterium GW2011_GWA1_50_14]|uniref:Uncharacterized protein n=1 Tax=Candidatus Liptonbacteria bacterium GWB1_49_6 TaxID=1798644 RepID=A0A1G2C7M8_9BACT|nr:MAG: hypothetical protein UY56_C0005G0066 [Parcubacteria group bacterium GW2011_GWA1_50_14]OGY96769.1 MAG: hypothetical protein A2122_00795 [Candidatus Liptonbacteria bacterium GWB1_49_6]
MRRLVLVLMAVAFAVFALPLVAVSHSPPGEVAITHENVGLAYTTIASQMIYRGDEWAIAKTNFFDSGNNDYLVPAVVRGIEPWNGCAVTITAIRGRDHRPLTPVGGAHFGNVAALADTRRMHSSCHADDQKS